MTSEEKWPKLYGQRVWEGKKIYLLAVGNFGYYQEILQKKKKSKPFRTLEGKSLNVNFFFSLSADSSTIEYTADDLSSHSTKRCHVQIPENFL